MCLILVLIMGCLYSCGIYSLLSRYAYKRWAVRMTVCFMAFYRFGFPSFFEGFCSTGLGGLPKPGVLLYSVAACSLMKLSAISVKAMSVAFSFSKVRESKFSASVCPIVAANTRRVP